MVKSLLCWQVALVSVSVLGSFLGPGGIVIPLLLLALISFLAINYAGINLLCFVNEYVPELSSRIFSVFLAMLFCGGAFRLAWWAGSDFKSFHPSVVIVLTVITLQLFTYGFALLMLLFRKEPHENL